MSEDGNRKICYLCVGEPYLSGLIEREGAVAACSYCDDDEESTIPIEDLAGHIDGAFERHYYRTSPDPDMYESMLLRDKELDYDWDRHGEPVLYAIEEAASIDEQAAQDVLDILEEQNADFESAKMGEECEFDADSRYEVKAVADHQFAFEFRAIERSLKSESRFFNQGAEEFLNRLFADLEGRVTRDGQPVIVTAGPEAKVRGFFRARVFHDGEELDQALLRPDLHLGPPPSRIARAGRMNAHGISVFYGASDPGVALAEVRPPVGSRALLGRFELLCPVRLLDVEALRSVYVDGSIFDPAYVEQLALAKFLGRLGNRITMPVMPDDEPTEYLITQMIADFLARRPKPGLDGILFRSVQRPGEHQNVVLFNHASKVAELELPEGTELTARQYDETEDGAEPDYSVWEETPPKPEEAASDEEEEHGFFGIASMIDPHVHMFDENADLRESFLRIDTGKVSVHHVQGVTFDVEEFDVRRHRSEKRDIRF